MNINKRGTLFIFSIFIAFLSSACLSSNSDDLFWNQTGTLWWYGSPAADGAGMVFVVDGKEYGAPGTPEDYPTLFRNDQQDVEIRADFKLTGEETTRGWGATYPAIEFIQIERI